MTIALPASLTKPVPRGEARSKAQAMVDATRARAAVLITGANTELARVLLDAERSLARRLALLEVGGRGDAWSAYDAAASMVMVREALGSALPRFRVLLTANAEACRRVGVESTAALLAYFEKRAGNGVEGGVIRPLALREANAALRPQLASFATSVDRYGERMIGIFSRSIAQGLLTGRSFESMTDELVGKRGPRGAVSLAAKVAPNGAVVRLREEEIGEGLFVRHRGWAERIVRTEGMSAMNAGALEEIVEQRTRFPDLGKKLVETFDKRTARDSYVAHGQVRAPGDYFTDGAGRRYLHPPGRPNDRAVVIPWRAEWS